MFDGKVVAITGAGGGLGRAYAHSFALKGAKVVVNDLGGSTDGKGSSSSMADKVVEEIKEMGFEAVANYGNVAEEEGAISIIETAVDTFGKLDILVNNAGILRDKTLSKMTLELWEPVIAVHLNGTYLCSRAAAEQMQLQGQGGCIINTTSVAGMMGNFGQTNYSSAKAGIAGFTRTAALELRRAGITVNAIAPIAKTRLTDDISAVPDDLEPEFVSPLVLFLASEQAKEITGKIFGVHGNHIFEYHMEMTRGVNKGVEIWKVSEIEERLPDISRTEADFVRAETKTETNSSVDPATKGLKIFKAISTAFLPDKAGDWNANLHFDIADCGQFTMIISDKTIAVSKEFSGDSTCVIKMNSDTFFGMAEGKIDATQAFMQGKITATNIGDMIKYGTSFDQKTSIASVKEAIASLEGEPAEKEEKKPEEKPDKGLNRDCLGKVYKAPPFLVIRDNMLGYARATNDANPYYVDESREDGIIAPVLYPVRIFHEVLWAALTDPELNCDIFMLLFGEQDMHFYEPLQEYDIIEPKGVITHMEKKETGEVFSLKQTGHRNGKLICETTSTFFIRYRKQPAKRKKKVKPKEQQQLKTPEFLFTEPMTVRKDQTYDYAKYSADTNPIHLDEDVAKGAGLGGIILHGLCSMAFASQAIVTHAADSVPTRLKRLKIRFAKPVRPGQTVTTQAWKIDSNKKFEIFGFRIVNDEGVEVASNGVAEVWTLQ